MSHPLGAAELSLLCSTTGKQFGEGWWQFLLSVSCGFFSLSVACALGFLGQ